jgi:hypothetical protein
MARSHRAEGWFHFINHLINEGCQDSRPCGKDQLEDLLIATHRSRKSQEGANFLCDIHLAADFESERNALDYVYDIWYRHAA